MRKTLQQVMAELPKERRDKLIAKVIELRNSITLIPPSNFQEPFIKEYDSI